MTSTKESDKELVAIVKLNAKEVDLLPTGQLTMSDPEGLPYHELGKVFDSWKKKQDVTFKGIIQGEKDKDGTYRIFFTYITELTVDGKVVFPK